MRITRQLIKRRMRSAWRYCRSPHIGAADIEEHLSQLGVRRGGVLLVHSSLSAPGYIVGGAEMVISVLLEFLGKSGTLMFPTHRWASVNRGEREFDVQTSPSEVGHLSERFRQWPGSRRSLHPSHSVCALGPAAQELTCDHLTASTPCGSGTPYAKLIQMKGQILLLGVGLRRNTCFHTVEAMANVPYLLKPDPDHFTITDHAGLTSEVLVRLHAKAMPSRFDELEQPLRNANCLRSSPLGASSSYLIDAKGFYSAMLPVLQQIPDYLLHNCPVPLSDRLPPTAMSAY